MAGQTEQESPDGDLAARIDTSKPSVARLYDAALGGHDNFPVDRAVLQGILDIDRSAMDAPFENRAWLARVTRWLASEAGIRQFLDLGSGLPTRDNTHQIAQRVEPDCLVVYVDNDPDAAVQGRALLGDTDQTRFVMTDLTKPSTVLAEPAVQRFLDLSQPIALYQIGTLHHYPGIEALRDIMRTYVDALVPGSYVAISHFYNPGGADAALVEEAERLMVDGPLGSGYFRTRDEIETFFEGLELVEPGLVPPALWWPDGPPGELNIGQRTMLCGLGRKV